MRWRSATDDVSGTTSSSTSTTATTSESSTANTSRRSLNEQSELDNQSNDTINKNDVISNNNSKVIDPTQQDKDNMNKNPNRLGSAKNDGNHLKEPYNTDPSPDSADTSTTEQHTASSSFTSALQNSSQSSSTPTTSNSESSSSRAVNDIYEIPKSTDEIEDDDDDDDDDGIDHAEDDPSLTPTIVWKPQTVQSTCEFTHTILDYAQKRESGCKKAEYSPITQDELGNRWRLIVYVNGNGRASNHHLSLFLQVADADDLPFGWKKAVSYVLTLEHPTNSASLSYTKRNPDKTFKLCPKAIDWGWSQFITSDRIQQEGFVKLDTLTVRAQVTVKSSSVVIDEEDSELYLKCAVEEGDANSVKLCLDHGASVNCQFKDDLYTPLHTACSSGTNTGSMDVLNILLESGADCNACNKWNETPLLIAANNGHKAAVEALLKHGADPSLCSEAGWSALTFAAHKGYDDIVDLLLKKGAPVNCPVTEDSSTPLHKACAGTKPGHLASVLLLLNGGADVHALNKWRETPLLTAANHGQAGAVEALLAHDADPCKCTDTGWSPLSIAAYKGHDTVVRLLLEDGAPTEEDDPTLSALLQAATKGLPDTVELLLRYGADHTVTTKKGDTALSILVEQNLIDAAVEMVTEYGASIPRCSRDRKKVQRARLNINLRMKHLEREGNHDHDSTDDDEETDDDHVSKEENGALPVENGSLDGSSVTKPDKHRKKEKPKELLEAKARLAEEALLKELETEDALAKVEEAKANNKNAKKKKKKERERLQKLKEDEERRRKEEQELKERERIRLEKEELRRKQRDEQKKIEEERVVKEMMEREKLMAAKRKEREEKEKLEIARRSQNQRGSGSVSPTEIRMGTGPRSTGNNRSSATDPTPNRKLVSPQDGKKPAPPITGSRRWETTSKGNAVQSTEATLNLPDSNETKSTKPLMPKISKSLIGDSTSVVSQGKSSPSVSPPTQSVGPLNDVLTSPLQFNGTNLEHPAVAMFRREKVTELIQRSTAATALVGELVFKRVLYRWIVRASHGKMAFMDPIIPSWIDLEQLVVFFQRQFIAENRRINGNNIAGYSMESLKEVGSTTARLCYDIAKQIINFRNQIDEQLSQNWTDASLGMSASDASLSVGGAVVTIFWSNNAQVFLPSLTFATLRDRHAALPNTFLTACFITKMLYECFEIIITDANTEFRLSPNTLAVLSAEVGVSAELWSDPFTVLSNNVFWGHFEHVDMLFGGQKPFGKDDHGSEEILSSHGGSICAFLPIDPQIASRYVQRMVDILDQASASFVPLSFALFISSDCFFDVSLKPDTIDLRSLDSRLGDRQSVYISRCDVLQANKHSFSGRAYSNSTKICSSCSYFVMLQNEAGKARFCVSELASSRILATLCKQSLSMGETSFTTPLINNFQAPLFSNPGTFDLIDPITPGSERAVHTDFNGIGGSSLIQSLSPVTTTFPRGGRRGRLFDLVDDGDEDQLNDDIMSGMLNNLDVGLFQNTNVGSENVDIEAIGIGGLPRPLGNTSHSYPRHRL